MNGHRHYGKVHRLGKEETDGILVGDVAIQEKIDGANVSIWVTEDGKIEMGSRTRQLRGDETFNGFIPYVLAHTGIQALLTLHPSYRLYGEWLVKHTIDYKATAYKKFYLFDIWVPDGGEEGHFLHQEQVASYAKEFGIDVVPMYTPITNPTLEQIDELVGKSEFGDRGEGVVLKNLTFKNGFGDMVYAKRVTESFKEDNGIVFGGNNKHSDTYWEMFVTNKYMTLERVQKILNKLQPEVNERLDMKHIPRIMGMAYHDMLTEEIWEIQAKVVALNFDALKRCCNKKSRQIFIDILNDSISVSDQHAV